MCDEDRGRALRVRARELGFDLSEEVLGYVLRRHPRDMHALFGLLRRLDRTSLAARSRLTVPLVRELIG